MVGGGGTTLGRTEGYEAYADRPQVVDMEKAFFEDLEVAEIRDVQTLAGTILETLRAGKQIQYTTRDVMMALLRAGVETGAVCHAIASIFADVVNKMALALGLPQQAGITGEGPKVITEKIEHGFLGLDEPTPSNVTGTYSASGRTLTYGKPQPGRVLFKDHTWVLIEGRHYDPVSGLSGAAHPPVKKLDKGAEIAVTLNSEAHTVTVYEKEGLRAFKLPVEDEQAQADLSVPLREVWVELKE